MFSNSCRTILLSKCLRPLRPKAVRPEIVTLLLRLLTEPVIRLPKRSTLSLMICKGCPSQPAPRLGLCHAMTRYENMIWSESVDTELDYHNGRRRRAVSPTTLKIRNSRYGTNWSRLSYRGEMACSQSRTTSWRRVVNSISTKAETSSSITT